MILDLDALLPPKKVIKLDGVEYSVNTGIPVFKMLKLHQAIQDNPSSEETAIAIIEILLFAFADYPQIKDRIERLTMEQMTAIVNYLFGAEEKNG